MTETGFLTEGEMALIFVNWKELIMANTKLLKWVVSTAFGGSGHPSPGTKTPTSLPATELLKELPLLSAPSGFLLSFYEMLTVKYILLKQNITKYLIK